MHTKRFRLLGLLADGKRHSGAQLAETLGITRAAVWDRIETLRSEGADIQALPGRGYKLAHPIELLDSQAILTALPDVARASLRSLVVHERTDSTNQRLLDLAGREDIHAHVHVAETQTRGRGRHGQVWIAPPGGGVCLSLGWRFAEQPQTFSALSLMAGFSVIEALSGFGASGLALKWPNDVVVDHAKLGGILIEVRSEIGGSTVLVVGVGINVALPEAAAARIDQPCTDLRRLLRGMPSRNALAAALIRALMRDLAIFAADGFAPWLPRWPRVDALYGATVRLDLPNRSIEGVAAGIDEHGALLLRANGRVDRHVSGRVSVVS
jgi:BirA family biotin operon repressor/biotin-[acetyl-CoA-carboxylase] ligase